MKRKVLLLLLAALMCLSAISLILKEVIRYKYSGQEGDEEYTEELATSLLDLSEVTIVSGNADFTTTGEKIFRIEFTASNTR